MPLYTGSDTLNDYLTGSSGADTVRGLGGDDHLIGDGGNDRLEGGEGSDLLDGGGGNDRLDGGQGIDTASYDFLYLGLSFGVNFNASQVGTSPSLALSDGRGGTDTLVSIENVLLVGTDYADTLTGSSGGDLIYGEGGNNRIAGGAGGDVMFLGRTFLSDDVPIGNSRVDGGTGSDLIVYSFSGFDRDVSFNASNLRAVTTAAGGDSGTDDLVNVEGFNVFGTFYDDHLTGSDLYDRFLGNDGDDTLGGRGGYDDIDGGDGDDVLDGGPGADFMTGGTGSDVYTVDSADDVVYEYSSITTDIDRVKASVNWTLGSNLEHLTLTGSKAINGVGNTLNNSLTGNSAPNALDGGAGADSLDGGVGLDTLIGGSGSDTYTVTNIADVVTESGVDVGAVDHVRSSVTWTLGANLENLTLTVSNAVNGTGNTGANTVVGNSGINILTGGAGADTLSGGGAADVFVFDSRNTSDLITDFVRNTDDLRVNQTAISIGDGDTVVDGARTAAGPGGFATAAELVVFTANISGDMTTNRAAVAIGSATSAYAVGDTRLFVVDNGVDTALYLFTAGNADARVSAAELQLLATLQGTPAIGAADILFGG